MCTGLVPYTLGCGICRVDVILIGSGGVLTVLHHSDHLFLSLLLSTGACSALLLPLVWCSVVSCCYCLAVVGDGAMWFGDCVDVLFGGVRR